MRPAPFFRHGSLRLGLPGVLLLVATLPGCDAKETQVQPADTLSVAQLAEIDKKVSNLMAERDGARLAAGIADSEAVVLRKNVTELQDRQRALETQLAELAARAPQAPANAPEGSSSGSVTGPGLPLPATPEAPISEDQVAAFRRIADEVQKRKDAEAAAERVRRELTRAGVALTPEQEATVIKLQGQYSDKMRELFRGGFGTTEADRQAMMDQRDALRTSFEADLRNQIPGAEADKIVEAMKRGWPGFFPRRTETRPGMVGNR